MAASGSGSLHQTGEELEQKSKEMPSRLAPMLAKYENVEGGKEIVALSTTAINSFEKSGSFVYANFIKYLHNDINQIAAVLAGMVSEIKKANA